MPTLDEENKELRAKVDRLEQALGRATFELSKLSKKEGATSLAAPVACSDVVACLTVADPAAAIAFYSQVLGAKEGFRIQDNQGRTAHAALQIGDSQVFINSEYPELGKISPGAGGSSSSVAFTVFVDDANSKFNQALRAGCRQVVPLRQAFWGDLTGTVADPFGHQWILSTNREQLSVAEIVSRAHQEFGSQG